jgi:hypothetical protein
MTDTDFPLSADGDFDDLPRTLRREREARARAQAAVEAPRYLTRDDGDASGEHADEPAPAAVTRIDVPFLRLVVFFLKAVIAAIPALILLCVILWFAGHLLQAIYPELVKMKILISFPNG